MISRRRTAVARPKAFEARSRKALADLRRFSTVTKQVRGQLRFSFDSSIWDDEALRKALLALFERKCAYCESELSETSMIVDRFRPEQEAANLDGRVEDPDRYWWLAYEWTNLYPACGDCREAKSRFFPVAGPRAKPETHGAELRRERRLLLDPCDDDPQVVLLFFPDGRVGADTELGVATIDTLALNRPTLVDRRRQAAAEVAEQLQGLSPAEIRKQRSDLAPTGRPYTALRLQLIDAHLGVVDRERPSIVATPTRTHVWLQGVHVHNFRSLRDLELVFPEPTTPDQAPWLLLLGVNGVGKSSVLQAIALAFMSAADRRQYIPDASQVVTRRAPEPSGRIVLTFSDGSTTSVRFERDRPDFVVEGRRPPPMNVYAYGSTRLPPAAGDRNTDQPRMHRLKNLFDPRFPLSRAEQWMASLDRVPSRTFTFLASSLRLLLELDEDDRLVRSNGALRIRQDGLELPLSEYSDGYRSMVAFATDLMLNLSERWDSIASAEGLVLVDELEVHLHPTWRMTAVDRLRTVFPRLRFVTTTHDPLCLRGSRPGEVHVLVRDEETNLVEARQRDVPPGLTADELLTGGWFGMATTLDEGTTQLMLEHGKLLLAPSTAETRERRTELEEELRERRGTFAETSDERLVRSVLAELRGDQPTLTDEQRKSAKAAILERVQAQAGPTP